jgi:hypothetical protein
VRVKAAGVLVLVVLALVVAACGGSGAKTRSKTGRSTFLTVGRVERAFAAAHVPLVRVKGINLSSLPPRVQSRLEPVDPIVQLEYKGRLPRGDFINVVVGTKGSAAYTIGLGSVQNIGTGKVISPSPGNVTQIYNVVIASRVPLAMIDGVGGAIEQLDKMVGL